MHTSLRCYEASTDVIQASEENKAAEPCIYLCGHSLGLQPRRTAERVSAHLSAWAKKAVTGHMTGHEDSELPPFLHVDEVAAEKMAPVVGALQSEVAVMETLTANLHFLMASFYRPSKGKYKIILEGKAFPSDHVRSLAPSIFLIFLLRNLLRSHLILLCARLFSMQSNLRSAIMSSTLKMR